jgi:ATP-binding cassette subfamily B protein
MIGFMLPYKRQMAGLCVTMLLTALIDVAFPLMTMIAIDRIIMPGETAYLPWFFIVYTAMATVQGFNVRWFVRFGGYIELHAARDMRNTMFEKLQRLTFSYYDRTPIGQVMTTMMPDVTRLSEMMAWSLVDGAWAAAYIVCVSIAMLILNPVLALCVLIVLPVLLYVSRWFRRKILEAQRSVRRMNAEIVAAVNEGIMGAKTTKTLVFEEQNLKDFSGRSMKMYRASMKSAMFSGVYLPTVMMIGSVAMAIVLGQGAAGVMAGTITLGLLSSFISYATGFFEPINSLARITSEMQSAQAAAERVLTLLDMPVAIYDAKTVRNRFGDTFSPKRENWPEMAGAVTFNHVTFRYNPDTSAVLEDFSLHVPAGQKVALVGETGAGKTTIVNLLGRFYEPESGHILIDGADIRERSQLWLQSHLGYVLQTPHLFCGTVRDNIRFGKPDATDEEVIRAARDVYAHRIIMCMPEGYDTVVGEGGCLLSTGQKQLVTMARMVLADPRIFVLDEATSSVDTQTEQLIQAAVDSVMKGRTSFIIAHRLSTIRSADVILVIENGKVVERGSHSELMKRCGAYHAFYTEQFEEQEQRRLQGKSLLDEIS